MLLDIEMPVMDGFEVLRQMKADKNLGEVRTLVISGVDGIDSIAKAIELGAVDILPKNFDLVILRARVNACLERSRSRDREKQAVLYRCNFRRAGLNGLSSCFHVLTRLERLLWLHWLPMQGRYLRARKPTPSLWVA